MNDSPIPGTPGRIGLGSFDGGYIEGGGDPFGIGDGFGLGVGPLVPPDYYPPILPPGGGDTVEPPKPDPGPVITKDPGPAAPPADPRPAAPTNTAPVAPTQPTENKDAAYWTEDVLRNGTQGFMDALLSGDPSAKAALKDPAFLQMLQMKRQEETQEIALISNLIKQDDARKMAVIRNISA